MPSQGQQELDQYIFTRPEMAKLLGISTNALRMRMKKGKCTLDYRFDGKKFLFKRPRDNIVAGPPSDHLRSVKNSHDKEIHDYDQKVQRRLNSGATHRGKGNYPNDVFQRHNEMKILNNINGRFKSDEHRERFERLNDKALKKIDKDIRKEDERRASNTYHGRPKYGGMITGPYGSQNHIQWLRPYDLDNPKPPTTSFNITGNPFCGYGNNEQMPEEKREVSYYWNEPKIKDPGADYKPGKFKHLDEAIRNNKKS